MQMVVDWSQSHWKENSYVERYKEDGINVRNSRRHLINQSSMRNFLVCDFPWEISAPVGDCAGSRSTTEDGTKEESCK